jgi:hypothetical protein
MRIALVYLGNSLPKYVLKNYIYIKKTFYENDVWLILDSKKIFDKIAKTENQVWLAPKIMPSNNTQAYRNNFWVETRNRFFALEKFHERFSDQSLLHIESDVVIFPTFPMTKIAEINKSLAFPMSSPKIGIASTLYFKTSEATKFLCEFTDNEVKNNAKITDTEILGNFFQSHPDKVFILRSGPDDLEAYNNSNHYQQTSLSGDKSWINDLGIYDASTLGIHLCGTDPRNHFGVSIILDPLNHHFLKIYRCKFELDNDKITLITGNEKRVIHSLHNHSKNIKLFDKSNLTYFKKVIDRQRSGKYLRFSIAGLLYYCLDYLHIVANKFNRDILRGGR